jgi:transglutaminase-like putative cysteine protease
MLAFPDPANYLEPCEVIDFRCSEVTRLASSLVGADEFTTADRCFKFVRDEIKHSSDHELNPVTCRASDVLRHRTGYCYAKSHLLAALLRANQIPAGLCYQRLTVDGDRAPFCIHGLNAVYLRDYGWYRIDARGNRPGIDAQFTPPEQKLAFPIEHPGERDLPQVFVRPLSVVVDCLQSCDTWEAVNANLPDVI